MPDLITFNDRSLKRLEKQVEKIGRAAVPFAIRDMNNDLAFETRKEYIANTHKQMTTRSTFIAKSIQVAKARRFQDPARTGALERADFMETQESGGVVKRKGKQGKPIATGYASGEGQTVRPRRKLVRPSNRLSRIELKHRGNAANRKQRNLVAVKMAAESTNKYVFLDLGRCRGIFKIIGGKRKPRPKMVYDLTRTAVTVPRNPMLGPAVDKSVRKGPDLLLKNFQRQLDRIR